MVVGLPDMFLLEHRTSQLEKGLLLSSKHIRTIHFKDYETKAQRGA